jgi:V/A-type H+/Na+-transporting ATPase subunit D
MPETQRELAMTRVAFLELKDEQQLVREGYGLLDEKRILLATQIHRQLARFRQLRAKLQAAADTAHDSTLAALHCHGLEELAVYPPLSVRADRLKITRSPLLGLELIEAQMETSTLQAPPRPVNPTPEARECALAHRNWLTAAVEVASCSVNLRRLVREYVRTERRARAIENLLLPEINSTLKFLEEQLEGLDQEELARLRQPRRA